MNENKNPIKGQLLAGAAEVDITPWQGVPLAGYVGRFRPAESVDIPLYARALVLESGGEKVCIVSLDLTIVTRQATEPIRRQAAREVGCDPDAVLIQATQTHSAPALGHFLVGDQLELPEEFEWIRGAVSDYVSYATERIVDAVRAADDSLRPVQMGVGSTVEGTVAANRRGIRRDGTVTMPEGEWTDPIGPTELLYVDGPVDPELGVICLREDDLSFPAMMVNYTCHPVHGPLTGMASADWPGALAVELCERWGKGCVPLTLNGACGNINPRVPFDPDFKSDPHEAGRKLARQAGKLIERLSFAEVRNLDWRTRRLQIPIRPIEEERLNAARSKLEKQPVPPWRDAEKTGVDRDWVVAAGLLALHRERRGRETFEYEVQAIRVGDAAVLGWPGEPFVEGQLQLKLQSPTRHTYVAHNAQHYVGYVPTKKAFEQGGHEVQTGPWSRLAPEALDTIVGASTEMLEELFAAD